MSDNTIDIKALQLELKAAQLEIAKLRHANEDLNERLTAYSFITSGQTSLINKLVDKVPCGVILRTEENIIVHSNETAAKILGVNAIEMEGLSCDHYFKNFSRDDKALAENHNQLTSQQIQTVVNDKYILLSSFISDEGSEKIIIETFMDITEIKHAEQALIETNKTKDEFLGMISHELRTPLNVIKGYCSLIEEEIMGVASDDVKTYIERVQSAEILLNEIVNNLLELSDLTSGKVKADNIPIDIEMISMQLQYRLQSQFEADGNTFGIVCEDIAPFEQDLALIMKALYELLINANKFTEKGDIKLEISIADKNDGAWISFAISDTGCGMTDETITDIFTAFHQADTSFTRSYDGLGLGLGIVEKILHLIGGEIDVESKAGVGSCFTLLLPYKPI